jgi:hypothetical protein
VMRDQRAMLQARRPGAAQGTLFVRVSAMA